MKAPVLEAIGETALDFPSKISAALTANDRIKYYLSLLQSAALHAAHPEENKGTLRTERIAARIEDTSLDDLIGQARHERDTIRIPGCGRVLERIAQDLRVMAEPVRERFAKRLDGVLAKLPKVCGDVIDPHVIERMTRAGGDGIHQFVMDVHKQLNALQRQISEERIEGAAVYRIRKSDRPLIASFMSGVNRTAPLKFSHPGLETTATRSGSTLVIQNDIGTTDAHVIVIHTNGRAVDLTYTDVHVERIDFLQKMLQSFSVRWTETRSMQKGSVGEAGEFHLITGRYEAKDDSDLRSYLEFLGSRLVFLIDWNRARRQLRSFLHSAQRIELLAWAAEKEIGHRGFLELGGAALINNAIEETAGSAMHFGDRLCDVLGDDAAMEFLRFVLSQATEGLRQHQSSRLIQDRIGAELQAHFSSEEKLLFQLACDHAGLIFEIASMARDGIRAIDSTEQARDAERARKYEHEADQVLIAVLDATRKRPEYAPLFQLVETADDAADELEEVVFLLGLLDPHGAQEEILSALASLSDLIVVSTQEWIKALHHARQLERRAAATVPGAAGDFLTEINRIFELEHQADNAERALTYAAVQHAADFRHLHVYAEIGRSLEAAADALKAAGVVARDYLLENVLRA
jgi:uncharacterized protein Yka (UPF0111/DUF47 family)